MLSRAKRGLSVSALHASFLSPAACAVACAALSRVGAGAKARDVPWSPRCGPPPKMAPVTSVRPDRLASGASPPRKKSRCVSNFVLVHIGFKDKVSTFKLFIFILQKCDLCLTLSSHLADETDGEQPHIIGPEGHTILKAQRGRGYAALPEK